MNQTGKSNLFPLRGNRVIILIQLSILTTLLVGCGSEESTPNPTADLTTNPIDENDPELTEKVEAIENIFYSVPSPSVTMNILENAGAVFDIQLTNDPKALDRYTDKTSRALNMGVYGADVNYCSAFDKMSDVMILLACTRSLGDELGLGSVFDQEVMDRLEENRDIPDSVQSIITKTFWDIESKLRDDGRPELVAMIVIGGWVEGMNIACGQAKINANNEQMIDQIAGQAASLESVIGLANKYQASDPVMKDLLDKLNDLKTSFDKMEVVESAGAGGTDDEGIPTIGKKIERSLSPELLEEITVKVYNIREQIIE